MNKITITQQEPVTLTGPILEHLRARRDEYIAQYRKEHEGSIAFTTTYVFIVTPIEIGGESNDEVINQ